MKNNMKIMGQLSVVLLICVLLGQGMWLYHVREIKLGEFRESANYVLLNTTYRYLYDESLNYAKNNRLTYSLTMDNYFYWYYDNKRDSIPIKSPDMVDKLGKLITYDYLNKHGLFDIFRLNGLYIEYLKEKGITENPILKVLNIEGEELQSTGNLKKNCNSIMTLPIELGYKNKHQLLATFELPFVFRALSGILWVELIFMIGFIFCLVWQWCSIRMTVRSARIQTMGMTHLEHELKKPLATMISVVKWYSGGERFCLMSPGYDKIDYGKGAFDEDGGYHRYDADFSKDFCIDDKPGSDRSEIRDGNDDRNVFIDPALRTGGLPDC